MVSGVPGTYSVRRQQLLIIAFLYIMKPLLFSPFFLSLLFFIAAVVQKGRKPKFCKFVVDPDQDMASHKIPQVSMRKCDVKRPPSLPLLPPSLLPFLTPSLPSLPSSLPHSLPSLLVQGVVIEGKYWKRTRQAVANEYRKWRLFHKKSNIVSVILVAYMSIVYVPLSSSSFVYFLFLKYGHV